MSEDFDEKWKRAKREVDEVFRGVNETFAKVNRDFETAKREVEDRLQRAHEKTEMWAAKSIYESMSSRLHSEMLEGKPLGQIYTRLCADERCFQDMKRTEGSSVGTLPNHYLNTIRQLKAAYLPLASQEDMLRIMGEFVQTPAEKEAIEKCIERLRWCKIRSVSNELYGV